MSKLLKNLLSVVVVNHNGSNYINKCVRSIFDSKTKAVEVVVVDNGSTDDSVASLQHNFSQQLKSQKLKIVSLEKNLGPALARNRGVSVANGEYLCFLDNDTQVDPDWGKVALQFFAKDKKIGVIQCKLLLSDKKTIDYLGEYLSPNGFLVQDVKGGTIDDGAYDQVKYILAAKSAGMFIRREAFDKVGGFDDDYFIYVEETDLGWRTWLAGYRNIFVPGSIVYHESGTSSLILGRGKAKELARYHGCKNYILTQIKNLEAKNLLIILPQHVFLWIGLAFYLLVTGKPYEWLWIMRGIGWNLSNLQRNLIKRKLIQKKRVITDEQLFKICLRKRSLLYFIKKVVIKHQVGNAKNY